MPMSSKIVHICLKTNNAFCFESKNIVFRTLIFFSIYSKQSNKFLYWKFGLMILQILMRTVSGPDLRVQRTFSGKRIMYLGLSTKTAKSIVFSTQSSRVFTFFTILSKQSNRFLYWKIGPMIFQILIKIGLKGSSENLKTWSMPKFIYGNTIFQE